jgi:ABC-type Zn uptake system ZnuABC Zn-binding protein ZnuA
MRVKELRNEISSLHADLGYWALRMREATRRPYGNRRYLVNDGRFEQLDPEQLAALLEYIEVLG